MKKRFICMLLGSLVLLSACSSEKGYKQTVYKPRLERPPSVYQMRPMRPYTYTNTVTKKPKFKIKKVVALKTPFKYVKYKRNKK